MNIITIAPFLMGIINGVKNPAPTPRDNTKAVLATTGVLTMLKAYGSFSDTAYVKQTVGPGIKTAGMLLAGVGLPGTVYCLGYMLARSAPKMD